MKEDRAVAEILKGTAEVGYKLSASSRQPPKKAPEKTSDRTYTRINPSEGHQWGVLGSLLQSDMQVDFIPSGSSSKTSVAMKGMTWGALGFYDYTYSPTIQFRALGGLEFFNISGTGGATDCDGSSDCNVNITYLSTYGGVKYIFYDQTYKLWAGGYYGFLWALSKASSVLKTAEITSNQLWVFSGGVDYPLKKGSFIPASIDYGLFPSSATVKAHILFLRVGWGTSF